MQRQTATLIHDVNVSSLSDQCLQSIHISPDNSTHKLPGVFNVFPFFATHGQNEYGHEHCIQLSHFQSPYLAGLVVTNQSL